MFLNKIQLRTISLPNTVTNTGRLAFSDCSGLTSVMMQDGITSIGDRTFENCSMLISVTIPNSITNIGGWAFEGTAWLANQPDGVIYINQSLYTYKGDMPANTSIVVRDGTTQICANVFNGSSGLTSVTIPNSVTSIGSSAFASCSELTSITIPNSVTNIGDYEFYYCSKLATINYEGTTEQWSAVTKGSDWARGVATTVVHCTDGDVNI